MLARRDWLAAFQWWDWSGGSQDVAELWVVDLFAETNRRSAGFAPPNARSISLWTVGSLTLSARRGLILLNRLAPLLQPTEHSRNADPGQSILRDIKMVRITFRLALPCFFFKVTPKRHKTLVVVSLLTYNSYQTSFFYNVALNNSIVHPGTLQNIAYFANSDLITVQFLPSLLLSSFLISNVLQHNCNTV